MHPIVCKIGPFTVFSYGIALAVAFFISSYLAVKLAEKRSQPGFTPDFIYTFAFTLFIAGIVGARIFFILENASFYFENPREMIMLTHGGLSWFGGLILSVIAGVVLTKKNKLSIMAVFDFFAPFAALGQAIGRIGCFFEGCCYGKPALFGIYSAAHDTVLIPVQIYSSLTLIFIFFILRFLQERPHKTGEIFFSYLFLYSIKRFFMEFIRADNPVVFAGLTLFQIISVAVLVIATGRLAFLSRR